MLQRHGYNIGIGFGYNSVKDEYKVVATYWWREMGRRFDYLAGVLTLRLDASNNLRVLNPWRVFSISDLGICGISEHSIYASGTINWLCRSRRCDIHRVIWHGWRSLYWFLENPWNPWRSDAIWSAKLMELHGRLCLIDFDAIEEEKRIDTWTMVSHEEWIKQYELK